MPRLNLYCAAIFLGALVTSAPVGTAGAASAPATWDDLVKVPSKRIKHVYLKPGANFQAYSKVILDPVQIAFDKDWRRDYNSQRPGVRISDDDVAAAVSDGGKAATEIFAKALRDGGFTLADAPAPDAARLSVGIINIRVAAPDVMVAGRSRSFSSEAGQATLVVEVRDSVTGAILGRAVDAELVGDSAMVLEARSSVTNRSDFRRVASNWAKLTIRGMNELRSSGAPSPK